MKNKFTAALAALVLAGCGGGDEPEPKEKPPAEREAAKQPTEKKSDIAGLIGKADEICSRFNDEWADLTEATPEYYKDWEKTNAKLEDLDVPSKLSDEWKQFLGARDQQLRFTKEGDGVALKQADDREEEAAKEIGLAVCGAG